MRKFALLLAAELHRYGCETRKYLSNYISGLILTGILIAMFALSTDARSNPAAWAGYFLWTSASTMITEASISISTDKQDGTFTQLMLRPVSLLRQIIVKTLTWVLVSVMRAVRLHPYRCVPHCGLYEDAGVFGPLYVCADVPVGDSGAAGSPACTGDVDRARTAAPVRLPACAGIILIRHICCTVAGCCSSECCLYTDRVCPVYRYYPARQKNRDQYAVLTFRDR